MTARDIKGTVSHVWGVYREKGVRYLVRSGVDRFVGQPSLIEAQLRFYRIFRSYRRFVFRGRKYRYLYDMYMRTWKNERAVEVPIVWSIVQENQGKEILEIGNVLSHYHPVKHEIVDKFEKEEGVINEDVVDFKSTKKYDLIVSISTLEHVGWDEDPADERNVLGDPTKIFMAIDNLKSHLAPKGQIVITVPMDKNPQLDRSLREGKLVFSERYCMRRVSRTDRWKEADWSECANAKYGYPYGYANAIVIGIIRNP